MGHHGLELVTHAGETLMQAGRFVRARGFDASRQITGTDLVGKAGGLGQRQHHRSAHAPSEHAHQHDGHGHDDADGGGDGRVQAVELVHHDLGEVLHRAERLGQLGFALGQVLGGRCERGLHLGGRCEAAGDRTLQHREGGSRIGLEGVVDEGDLLDGIGVDEALLHVVEQCGHAGLLGLPLREGSGAFRRVPQMNDEATLLLAGLQHGDPCLGSGLHAEHHVVVVAVDRLVLQAGGVPGRAAQQGDEQRHEPERKHQAGLNGQAAKHGRGSGRRAGMRRGFNRAHPAGGRGLRRTQVRPCFRQIVRKLDLPSACAD
jgi:hypothetical protein